MIACHTIAPFYHSVKEQCQVRAHWTVVVPDPRPPVPPLCICRRTDITLEHDLVQQFKLYTFCPN